MSFGTCVVYFVYCVVPSIFEKYADDLGAFAEKSLNLPITNVN